MYVTRLFQFLAVYLLVGGLNACNQDENLDCIDLTKVNRDAVCYALYEPVCGCDGNTYSNSCEAQLAGLISWEEGECIKAD
ncbi:MAG: hypothetical protein IH947_11020 [Bacteroidetes bacterium]|nr:hypothetical protein [Bacteroidota bacterium]